MKNRLLIPVLLLWVFVPFAKGQATDWRLLVEQLAEEEARADGVENLYEELAYLENNPLNLNSVERSQLERFPLLSPEEVERVMLFLERNRPLFTVYELRNVPGLDYKTVALILPFFKAEPAEESRGTGPGEMLKRGRHEVQVRTDKTLTTRGGYREYSDSILARYPNRQYVGEDFYSSLRYSFRYRDKVQMGFTAEKDAGEPFLRSGYPKGYDHYGMHVVMRDLGRLKTLVAGDFRLSFGQGLVLNNDFAGSKAWGMGNLARRTRSPKRHFSTAERGFFRGGAAEFLLGDVTVTTFYSNRSLDANVNEAGEITSLKEDGLHRTRLDWEKRKNTREQVGGANVNYRKHRLQVGVSAVYHAYDRSLNPSPRSYNQYYLRDTENMNAGIDYSYQLPGVIFAGETAWAKGGAVATLHLVQYRPASDVSFALLHRYYPITYNALHAQAFSEGGRVQNEHGLYAGVRCKPMAMLSVDSYIDLIRFPWLKQGVDAPSSALDAYLLVTYAFTRHNWLEARVKFKQKEKNGEDPAGSKGVVPYHTGKFRLRYVHEFLNGWSSRSTMDFAEFRERYLPTERGYLVSQAIAYRGEGSLSGDAYVAWFDADSYNARLYSYERNLLSSFYMPSFYGKGVRGAVSIKWQLTEGCALSMKMGHTHYLNRETIGSGTELIEGNYRTDLFTYLVWRF